VDLHVVDVPRGSLSRVQVELQATPHPWMSLTMVGAVVCAGVLWGLARTVGQHPNPDDTASASLLIALAAGFSALVWRPGEHRLAVRLLSAAGMLAAATAGFLLLTAMVLTVAPQHRWCPVIEVIAATCSAIALVLIASLIAMIWRSRGDTFASPWDQGRQRVGMSQTELESYQSFERASERY